ncbi:MAG: 2-amino-3,7-dideoxy-D-threo-hept-6-ulosonate synthase [Armatimonadetes bacterium]|jgi:predicted phospho-2-dehydro-3-deoxyheptonate aldolase|nr:2-amino-3,7-dideoxy-D-threo-hept-6-ulosonate synthase [Armatimonadota bacterium]MDI9585516.1 2-amino-3,7-dideoxy-D-threo-hept-6-ulosonate synthase [Acidobacteriota bacterium]
MSLGKAIRIERISNRANGRAVLVPMDHGVTMGPIEGLVDMPTAVNNAAIGGADAVIGHVGLPAMGHRRYGPDIGLILHLSASTALAPDPNRKVLVSSVERAIRYGADGVSVHVNLGAADESEMLRDLGQVATKCEEWGMPLLAMVYTRGAKIQSEYDVKVVAHAARVAAELGADMVKVAYTGDVESFRTVVEGCGGHRQGGIKVLIAGGEKMETDREILEMVAGCIEAGGAGVSIGRNAFQHAQPEKIVAAICGIVHKDMNVDEALGLLGE